MTYQHLGAEECAIQYKRAKRKARAWLILMLLGLANIVTALVSGADWLFVSGVFATGTGFVLLNSMFLEPAKYVELMSPQYEEAIEIATGSPAAAAQLRAWTEQSSFLAARDLDELREIVERDRPRGAALIDTWRKHKSNHPQGEVK